MVEPDSPSFTDSLPVLLPRFLSALQSTHPGLLKVSGLQEGVYTFQMTITDTSGQKSSDNVSVTVLAPKHQAEGERRPWLIQSCTINLHPL